MNLHLTTTAVDTRWDPYATSNFERLQRAARQTRDPRHSLAGDAAGADVILFVGSRCKFHWDVLASPIYKAHAEKCLLFDFLDNTIPRIPGLYLQIPRALQAVPLYEQGFYIRVADNRVLRDDADFSGCRYLFSFVGRVANEPIVRGALMRLQHPRGHLEDATSGQSDQDVRYADVLAASKFVLCPRGIGPSSWRLFETMRCGRVPVIVSDEWKPPPGLAWGDISVRVSERDIATIPSLLERLEPRAAAMGDAAREAWRANFSLEGAFTWVADTCARIQAARQTCAAVAHRSILAEALAPKVRRLYWREWAGETLRRTGLKR